VLSILLLSGGPASAVDYDSFPPDEAWEPLICGSAPMFDPQGDQPDAPFGRDLVGDDPRAVGFVARGDLALFVRMRLDRDPAAKQALEPSTWAVLFDTDGDPASYEATVRLDGASDTARLFANAAMETPGDLREAPDEPALGSWSLAPTVRTVPASDSNFGDDADTFLDVRLLWADLAPAGIAKKSGPDTITLGTSSQAEGPLDGDLVCRAPGGGAGGDTGELALLKGAGGCATAPAAPLGWLVLLAPLCIAGLRRSGRCSGGLARAAGVTGGGPSTSACSRKSERFRATAW